MTKPNRLTVDEKDGVKLLYNLYTGLYEITNGKDTTYLPVGTLTRDAFAAFDEERLKGNTER